MDSKPLKVSEVNQYIKRTFLGDWLLSNIEVEGEISNFKHHYSGHMYFSLKDDKGKLKCVMFKSDNQSVELDLKDGMKIIAKGYVSVYEREGEYQLYVKKIKKSGVGDLFTAFEKLKNKLEKEGLFRTENKKELPFLPNKIGVVTSSTGAAIRDILTVIERRFPIADILIYPSLVQGVQAPKEICEGLVYLDNKEDIDVIIVGRGGGSFEELFAFNDESVARTMYSLKTPVIAAIGHETDFTIADFVSDLRAATPSAAAELATPQLDKLITDLEQRFAGLCSLFSNTIDNNKIKLNYKKKSLDFYNPLNQLNEKMQDQDNLLKRLIFVMRSRLEANNIKIANLANNLNYLNPISSLDRGYGIILDHKDDVIASIDKVSMDEELRLLIKDGIIDVKVVKINKGEFYNEK